MGHLIRSTSAWTITLIPMVLGTIIGGVHVMLWTFDVGNYIAGQGPAPWPW